MIRLLLLAVCFLPSALFAQAAVSRDLEIRFLAERSPKDIGKVVMAIEEKRSEAFDLPSNYLSIPYNPPARTFSLRTTTPDVPLATIVLPEDGKAFVVILVPAKEGGFKPIVIRSDDTGFRQGDVYFYNHCPKLVLGYVGTAKFSLEPAKGLVLHPGGARSENFYDVGFGVREEKGDRILSNTRWPVDDKVRSYVFFFVNPVTGRIDFRAVEEFIPPVVKAEQQ
ncbi:MAG: hypothetical protein ABIT37_09645 [Luteolibacter sp.]